MTNTEIYRFDLTASSFDMVQAGLLESRLPHGGSRVAHVVVAAESALAAERIAFEMVSMRLSRFCPDVFVTSCQPVL